MTRTISTVPLVAMVTMIAVVVLIAGCDSSSNPQRAIAKAQEYREKGDNKAAIIEIKNFLQKNPDHAEARYVLGAAYYDNRNYHLAEQELRRTLQLSYERSKVMPVLGKSMLMLGEYQKVLDQIPVEAHASNLAQADILTLRARALLGLRQVGPARELLDAALVKQPEFADALVEQARLAAKDQKLDESARLIARVIASAPRHVEAWLGKGDLAHLNADQSGVMAANQKVIEIAPTNVAARRNIAALHMENNKLGDARTLLAQARALAPDDIATIHMLALVDFLARDYKAANNTIQQVLKVAPDFMPGVFLAGLVQKELGSYEQAQAHLARVLEWTPENLFARRSLASALAQTGQLRRAIEVLQPGLKQAPNDPGVTALAGELYLQNSEFVKAAQYFDVATKSNPKDATSRSRLGISRMASGDMERAFADLESAVALDATNYQADLALIVANLNRSNYEQALVAMESLEKKQPNNPVTFNLKAVILMGKKDIPAARKNFERALELKPTFLAAAANLAQLDIQEKNPKGARARLESLLGKNKNDGQVLLALAELGPALGATQKEQVNWLERARMDSPQSVPPQLMLARLYFQMGETKKALEIAQNSYAQSPDNPQLLDLLGAAQLNAGQNEQALVSYRKLLQIRPDSAVAYYRLASVQSITGDARAATETLKQALSLQPDFIEAMIALVPLHIYSKRYAEAKNIAVQIQKKNPKVSVGHILEGDVLMAEKQYAQAIKAYETALGTTKDSAIVVKLHKAYVTGGKSEEGNVRLGQWLKDSPDDVALRLYAAGYELQNGRYQEAIAHYEFVLKKQPDNIVMLNNLAAAYLRVKDVRAVEVAERAYKIAPGNPVIADTLAMQLIKRGDVARGVEILEAAVKTAPNVAELRYHLAQGWIKAGDSSKARAELERALAINEKFTFQAEAKSLLKELRK